MEIDPQWVINGLLVALGACLGYIVNGVRQSVLDLQKQDQKLADKVQQIEVVVAGQYVPRDEFDRVVVRLFDKLDSMDKKLDRKVDR